MTNAGRVDPPDLQCVQQKVKEAKPTKATTVTKNAGKAVAFAVGTTVLISLGANVWDSNPPDAESVPGDERDVVTTEPVVPAQPLSGNLVGLGSGSGHTVELQPQLVETGPVAEEALPAEDTGPTTGFESRV